MLGQSSVQGRDLGPILWNLHSSQERQAIKHINQCINFKQ